MRPTATGWWKKGGDPFSEAPRTQFGVAFPEMGKQIPTFVSRGKRKISARDVRKDYELISTHSY